MIRDVAELRAFGQVCRRVAELDIDVDTWRAGMRRAARGGGMRIRTFVVEPAATADCLDEHGRAVPTEALVYAVRTDLTPDPTERGATRAQLAADHLSPTAAATRRPRTSITSITSITDERARRAGHPCIEP